MSKKNEIFELTDDELEKVSGGVASVSGWSSYKGKCECGKSFEVSNKGINSNTFVCSCNRTYKLIICSVYCDDVLLPSTSYEVTDHDS